MKEFFNPGDIIFKENESYDYCYYIISGKVHSSLRMREFSSNEFIGVMSFLTGKPLLETYTANSKVEALKLDKKTILSIIGEEEFSLLLENISTIYVNLSYKSLLNITPNIYDLIIKKAKLKNRKDLVEETQLNEVDSILAELDQILNAGEIFETEIPEDIEILEENFKSLFNKENIDLAGIIVFTANYIRKNKDNKKLCEDLKYGFEKSIEIEDRALVKYFLYLICLNCKDKNEIKNILEQYLELLRFWGVPSWGEMLIRIENYESYLEIISKKGEDKENEI
ncbi:cyclic nucleotide-binding domain-containing protein [Marinitoga sp. 38H-ov]|uniref:cyclic nucleotide-binding domain-containing protein n=1 Tax=Marinitoga sp. 38H-ov TaxID=1755814 RepID=UPI0013ED0065|nr:cyclic nucleotide-binding domain-containing protein [Marinitoga sp. 38H-ov]KAF2956072.1 hypothetical protein AS160_07880 [Marinitoga sp. 38H-ov]